jgi:hypothetical protein
VSSRRPLPAPRWQTPLPPGVVGSWGPDVGAYVRAELGLSLDRWQQRGLNRALAYDAALQLVHRHYLLSAARQNGKTVGVRGLVGWAMTARAMPDWRLILGLAHDRGQARVPYEAVYQDLSPIRRRYARQGGLALTRYLGIRSDLYGRHREYHIASREGRDTIRSLSVDVGVFDEVRTQRTYDTWAALEPTTRARPDPLILAISTAGDDRSVLLRDWWERGIRIIEGAEPADGFGMTWYAAGDDDDPQDPAAIRRANPAVAEGRIPIGPVAASIRSLTPSAYRQETLNLWATGGDEWLPPGTWLARIGPQPELAGQRVVLGVESAPTWSRASVTVAILNDVGAWGGVAGELDAQLAAKATVPPEDLTRLVARLIATWHPSAIAYSAASACAPYAEAAAAAARIPTVALGAREVRAASALFRSELVGARFTHADDPMLAQQVRAARPSAALEGGDWYISIRESVGHVDGIRSLAWAAWAAIAPPDRKAPPQVFL